MAFGTDESVLFREVSLIQGVLIEERFHCIPIDILEVVFAYSAHFEQLNNALWHSTLANSRT